MPAIVYGTHVFTKFKGYYGRREECPICHKIYSKGYVHYMTWAHLEFIPLFPIKNRYIKMCPICGNGIELKSKPAKAEMNNLESVTQNFDVYAKRINVPNPQTGMGTITIYEVWVRDLSNGEETCIASDPNKKIVKNIKKARGLKKIQIYNV